MSKNSLKRNKAKLRGEFVYKVFGKELRIQRIKGIPRIWWFIFCKSIFAGNWEVYKTEFKEIFHTAIQDWDELTYEDLWRDPEEAFKVYKAIRNGN